MVDIIFGSFGIVDILWELVALWCMVIPCKDLMVAILSSKGAPSVALELHSGERGLIGGGASRQGWSCRLER